MAIRVWCSMRTDMRDIPAGICGNISAGMPAMKCVKLIKRHILYINVIIENVTSGFLAFGYLNINGNETYSHSFVSTVLRRHSGSVMPRAEEEHPCRC